MLISFQEYNLNTMSTKLIGPAFLAAASAPEGLWRGLVQEAARRDLVTARRTLLVVFLWQESYLPQETLVARVRYRLGPDCFGSNSALTFRRDMQAVKAILAASGFVLSYSRRAERPGYTIEGRPDLAPEIIQAIRGAAQEVDPRQIEAWNRLTAGQRLALSTRLSDDMLGMAVHRLMQERPELDRRAAQREVLHRYYQLA